MRGGFRRACSSSLDRRRSTIVRRRAAITFPAEAGAIVLLELDGDPTGWRRYPALRPVCEDEGRARGDRGPRTNANRERLWETRRLGSRSLREGARLKARRGHRRAAGSIPEMLRRSDAIGGARDCSTATYGHAGDGNLHINVLTDETETRALRRKTIDGALAEIFRAALDRPARSPASTASGNREGRSTRPGAAQR